MFFKIKKFLIRIIALFIPIRKYRSNFREKYFNKIEKQKQYSILKKLKNYYPVYMFKKHRIKPKSVLVLEFNDFHGITLPGYMHYFAKLGYNVDVFLRFGQNVAWKPLCRLKDKYKAFVGDEFELKENLNSEKIKQYDFVFVNTTFYYGVLAPYPKGNSTFKLLGLVPSGKYGTLMIEHNLDPYVKKYHEEKYIKAGNLFTLLGFRGTKMLSSSYVGDVKFTPKSDGKVKFLSIGTIHPGNKNMNLLFNACKNLIKSGLTNFEIQVIGLGNIDDLPKQLRPYFKILGGLTYEEMFNAIEEGDYLLNLFDPKNKEHHKYLDNWATGSSILFYAFGKLPLMHKLFAPSYHLDDKNSIVYTKLYDGMKIAIEMTKEEYAKRQESLINLTKDLQEKSLQNLTEQMKRMQK